MKFILGVIPFALLASLYVNYELSQEYSKLFHENIELRYQLDTCQYQFKMCKVMLRGPNG